MGTELTDSNFQSEVSQSEKPVMVHFSLASDYDSKISSVLDKLLPQYSNDIKFGIFKMSETTSTDNRYGVSMAPTLLIFVNGKAVAQIVGAVDKEVVSTKINIVLKTPFAELPELSLSELKKAYKQSKGQWDHVILSGLVSGVAFAFARVHLEGPIAFLVPAFVYGVLISNKNLGFSGLQKILATALMFGVGMYWREILELMK